MKNKALFLIALIVMFVTACTQYIPVWIPGGGNDNGGQTDFVPDVTTSDELVNKIEAIQPGETVEIKLAKSSVPYALQTVIPEGADVTLIGESDDVVLALPDDDYSTGSLDNIPSIDGSLDGFGVVVAKAGSKVTFKNITLQLDPEKVVGSSGLAHQRLAGIMAIDSDLVLDNVTIKDIRCSESDAGGLLGMQTGYGIYIADGSASSKNTVSITNCTISGFQKGGIYIGAHGQVSDDVTITGCTITGIGNTDKIGQNGIVVDTTGDITIEGNTFQNLNYTPDDTEAYGVLVYGKYVGNTTAADAFVKTLEDENTFASSVEAKVYVEGQTE